jgi:hypothetical protein
MTSSGTNFIIEFSGSRIEAYRFLARHHYFVSSSRVEAGSNTSTVAVRVVGGDEKGTQCLGV